MLADTTNLLGCLQVEPTLARISPAEEAMMQMIFSGERQTLPTSQQSHDGNDEAHPSLKRRMPKVRPASAAMAAARAHTRAQEKRRREAAAAVERAAVEKAMATTQVRASALRCERAT